MKRASTSLRKCDVEALRKMFAEHSMDEEHAELEELMKRASTSLRKCDVEALRKMFAEHSTEEEDLMRRSNFGGGGGGGMFSAVDSHAADHASILEVASEVVASAGEE